MHVWSYLLSLNATFPLLVSLLTMIVWISLRRPGHAKSAWGLAAVGIAGLAGTMTLVGCWAPGPPDAPPIPEPSALFPDEAPWVHYPDVFDQDPAAPGFPGTLPYHPFLVRQANCSLTRGVIDANMNVVAEMPDYQDFLHSMLQVPTTGDKFPAGCKAVNTGITNEVGVVLGQLSTGNIAIAETGWPYISPDGVLVTILNSNFKVVSQQDYPTIDTSNPRAAVFGVATADLNGDGNADIVVASETSGNTGSLVVLLGKGDGTFTAGQTLSVAQPTANNNAGPVIGVTIDDVNGDGKLDLIAVTNAKAADSGIFTFTGNGDGTFATNGIAGPVGSSGQTAVTADFNGDGKKDIATSFGQILLGNGDGTFQLQPQTMPEAGAGLAAADFNADGKVDLAFSNSFSTADVYYGNGDGTFTYAASYPAIQGAQSVQSSDLDGDGFADIFIGTASSGLYTVDMNTNGSFESKLNRGDGTFSKSRAYFNGTNGTLANAGPTLYGLGAFTGGSTQDLVMMTNGNGSGSGPLALSVRKGNGDGTFQVTGTQSSITGPLYSFEVPGLAVADVNGDGKPDVAFAWGFTNDGTTPHFSVALGNGDGTFQAQKDYSIPAFLASGAFGQIVNSLLLIDVNGDGMPDAVFITGNGLYVMLNNGSGSFAAAQLIDTQPSMTYLAAADVNGDGKTDIVVNSSVTQGTSTTGTGLLYLNNGNGTFKAASPLNPGPLYPVVLAIADMNGDGRPDVIFAGLSSSVANDESVTVLLGNGDGTFQAGKTTVGPNDSPTGIAILDANLDGKLDVVLGGSSPYLMPGNGDGTFDTATSSYFPLGINCKHLSAAILNGQEPPELLLTSSSAIEVFVATATPAALPAASDTTLTASATTIDTGAPVTLTATVASSAGSASAPAGTVVFFDGAANIGSAPINASGVATLASQELKTAGKHSIVASYGGNPNFLASASTAVTVTVSSTPLTATTTTLTASATTINAGAALALNAAVSPTSGTGTPTGTVTFLDGTTTLGTGTLAKGSAGYSTSSLAAGTHSLTAVYGGDPNFSGSTSSAVTVTVQAVPASFTVSASPASLSITPGQSGTATLSVTPAGGFAQAVTFACSSGLPSEASCTFAPSTVTPGASAATTTLTVTTTAPQAAAERSRIVRSGVPGLLALASLLLFAMSGTKRAAGWGRWFVLAIALAVAGGFIGCGGGGSSGGTGGAPTNPGTPAGTSSVTVTATSGSITQTTTLQVTVQ